jgi:hypothetical protein
VVLVDGEVACVDAERAAAGHGVPGVDRQVDRDLFDLTGIGDDGPELRCRVDVGPYMIAERPPQERRDAAINREHRIGGCLEQRFES